MSNPATAPSVSDPVRVEVAADAAFAFRCAVHLWETYPHPVPATAEALQATFATVMIAVGQRREHPRSTTTSAPGSPVVTRPTGEAPPPCPKCRGPMVATGKKTPRMPDFRCADRACDTPLWLNKRNGAHP
jgi:hypothetical protein